MRRLSCLAAATLAISAARAGPRRRVVGAGRRGRLLGRDRGDRRGRPRLPRWWRRPGLQRGGRRPRRELPVHGCGLLPDLRAAPARLRLPDQRPAGVRPVRQHAAVGRLLGAVVVRREVRVVDLLLAGRRVAERPRRRLRRVRLAVRVAERPERRPLTTRQHAAGPDGDRDADLRWRRGWWPRERRRSRERRRERLRHTDGQAVVQAAGLVDTQRHADGAVEQPGSRHGRPGPDERLGRREHRGDANRCPRPTAPCPRRPTRRVRRPPRPTPPLQWTHRTRAPTTRRVHCRRGWSRWSC